MDPRLPVNATLEECVYLVSCPACNAPRGEQCKTRGGRLAPVHLPRYEAAKAAKADQYRLERWNRECRKDEG